MKYFTLLCALLLCLSSCKKEVNEPDFKGRPEGPLVSTMVVKYGRDEWTNYYYYDTQRRLIELTEMNSGRTFLQYIPGKVNVSSYEYGWIFTFTEGSVILGNNGLLSSAEYSGVADDVFMNTLHHTTASNYFAVSYNENNHIETAYQIKRRDIYYIPPYMSGLASEQRQFEDNDTLEWDENGNLIRHKHKRITRMGDNGVEDKNKENFLTSIFTYTNHSNPTFICLNLGSFIDKGAPIPGVSRYAELGLLGNLCPYLPEHEEVIITDPAPPPVFTDTASVYYTYYYTFSEDGLLKSATRQADDPNAYYAQENITWNFTYYE